MSWPSNHDTRPNTVRLRQRNFVSNLLQHQMNATEAYLATYDHDGTMSRASARANGARLLAKDSVQQVLWEAIEAVARRNEVSEDFVLQGFRRMTMADVFHYFDVAAEDGKVTMPPKDLTDLPEWKRRNVREMKVVTRTIPIGSGKSRRVVTEQEVQLKLVDAKGAYDGLAKCLGMFLNRPEKQTVDHARIIREGTAREMKLRKDAAALEGQTE